MRFRNCLGMIWSVSTLGRGSGATSPSCARKGCIGHLLVIPGADVGEMSGDGCSGGHGGAHQVGAPAASLASFKIAIAGGGAALAGREDVGIHSQTHGAAGFPPFEAGGPKDLVQTFL